MSPVLLRETDDQRARLVERLERVVADTQNDLPAGVARKSVTAQVAFHAMMLVAKESAEAYQALVALLAGDVDDDGDDDAAEIVAAPRTAARP